jgi:hypothetical protein
MVCDKVNNAWFSFKCFAINHSGLFTGEEVLHEGWSSYDNLFGVLMITVTEFLENVTDFYGKLFYLLGELT